MLYSSDSYKPVDSSVNPGEGPGIIRSIFVVVEFKIGRNSVWIRRVYMNHSLQRVCSSIDVVVAIVPSVYVVVGTYSGILWYVGDKMRFSKKLY